MPAYNEALNIEKTIKDITKNTNYDYVVINDCSRDNTKEVCEKNGFNMVSLPINFGLTSAIQVGMKYAKKYGYGSYKRYGDDREAYWIERGYKPEYYNFFNDGMRWSTSCEFC